VWGLGIPVLEFDRREADDVILHVVWYLTKLNSGMSKVAVISEDMDLCQCIQCSVPDKCEVELHRPVRDLVLTRTTLDEHLGYPAIYYKWYKAMVGKIREVNGIPGVGQKTAISLIHEAHDNDTTLIELVKDKKGKRYERLSQLIDDFYIGLALSDLFLEELREDERNSILDAMHFSLFPARVNDASLAQALEVATTLEFHSLTTEWPSWIKPFMDAMK
jgi:5'-3' exonuclease